MKSDEQLMLEYQAGSPPAFDELFSCYRSPVYGFLRRPPTSPARVEALAHDTFLAILRGTEDYVPQASFRTYLYAIAIKQLWSERRREIRAGKVAAQPQEVSRESDPSTALWIRDALEQL